MVTVAMIPSANRYLTVTLLRLYRVIASDLSHLVYLQLQMAWYHCCHQHPSLHPVRYLSHLLDPTTVRSTILDIDASSHLRTTLHIDQADMCTEGWWMSCASCHIEVWHIDYRRRCTCDRLIQTRDDQANLCNHCNRWRNNWYGRKSLFSACRSGMSV